MSIRKKKKIQANEEKVNKAKWCKGNKCDRFKMLKQSCRYEACYFNQDK